MPLIPLMNLSLDCIAGYIENRLDAKWECNDRIPWESDLDLAPAPNMEHL